MRNKTKKPIPVGYYSDASNFVAAGNIVAKYSIAEKLAVIASAGFTNYFGKNDKFIDYNDNGDPQMPLLKQRICTAYHCVPVQDFL